jgi:hypothetical protein
MPIYYITVFTTYVVLQAGNCLLISGGLLLLLLVLQPQPSSTQSLGPLVPALADQLVS